MYLARVSIIVVDVVFTIAALGLTGGCEPAAECRTVADCPTSWRCVDGLCRLPPEAPGLDADVPEDARVPNVEPFDGGTRSDDAATPPSGDAGLRDAGLIDAGCGECEPGDRETDREGCGACRWRLRERVCGTDCRWSAWSAWSACREVAVCEPGETEMESCGYCGTRTRTCTDACEWGAWSGCGDEGVCAPGETQTESCGNCGTRSRTCTTSCGWGSWTACSGEGECTPGETESQDCYCNGTQSRTCDSSCSWEDWSSCAPSCAAGFYCNDCTSPPLCAPIGTGC